jgi:probable addiction module antidote protein
MALKTTRWDSAQHLGTEEERASYLDACFEEAGDDAAFVAYALGVVARSRNMSQLARDTGLTREGLYKALSEEGNPSFGTVLKVMGALGYRFAVVRETRAAYSAKPAARPAPVKASGSRAAAAPRRASRKSGSRAGR